MATVSPGSTAMRCAESTPASVLFESLPSAVLFLSEEGRVVMANPRAAIVLQRPRESLEGQPVDDLLAPLPWLIEASQKPRADRAVKVSRGRGEQMVIGFSLGDAGDQPPEGGRYALVFEDITEWATVREERDRLLKVAAMGSALPTLLHELKNPLASITAATEVLLEEVSAGPLSDQLHAVLSEVRRMKLSLDGVATMGRSLLSPRHSAIDYACREAFTIMASRARATGLHSHCEIEDMPLLPLDPAVVSGVVHNLMVNAIQACTTGQSVNLYARLVDRGRRFVLDVVDNGPGMSAEVYGKCTDLFFTTKRNGSGIGLALCRRAAEEAGGELRIESVVGFGTSVTFSVPLPAASTVAGR